MIGALVAGITGSGGASLSSYESIATAAGTGSSGTITFSSIPSTFKHLQIRAITRNSSTQIYPIIRPNNDSNTANYTLHQLYGNGTAATAYGSATGSFTGAYSIYGATSNQQANVMGAGIVDILDYGSTTKYKTIRSLSGFDDNNASTGYIFVGSSLWLSTSAITSITIAYLTDNFTSSSIFALYGIKEA